MRGQRDPGLAAAIRRKILNLHDDVRVGGTSAVSQKEVRALACLARTILNDHFAPRGGLIVGDYPPAGWLRSRGAHGHESHW